MARSRMTLSVAQPDGRELGKSIISAVLFTALEGGVPVARQQPVVRSIGSGGDPHWFWPGRIQAGQVTVIEGDAGSGKSIVAFDLAARCSRGAPFPAEGVCALSTSAAQSPNENVTAATAPAGSSTTADSTAVTDRAAAASGSATTRPARNVLLITLQDGENVVDNRLQRMGADCERILAFGMVRSCEIDAKQKIDESNADPAPTIAVGLADLERGSSSLFDDTTEERPVSFPFDLPMVEYYLKAEPAIGLVVIDPLSDFCQTAGQLEETLRKLQILAQRSGVAIVVTLPVNARFDSRGGFKSSSRWKSDAARAVWCIAADPDDRRRRLFFPRRTSGIAEPDGLEFRIESGRVVWNEQSIVSFDDPLGRETEIRNFLKRQLQHQSRSARAIFQSGGERGYTRAQIRYVAKRMGIAGRDEAGAEEGGEWTWRLPDRDEFPRVEAAKAASGDHLEKSPATKKDEVVADFVKRKLMEKLRRAFEREPSQGELPPRHETRPERGDWPTGTSCQTVTPLSAELTS